jgi:hypothetical protein
MSKWVTAAGLRIKRGSALYKWFRANKADIFGWFKKPKPPAPKPVQLFMFDDINVSLIPKDAQAVAGYIGGKWPTYTKLVGEFPNAKHLSIAVSVLYDADCLDVEPGDASVTQAPVWVKRQLKLRKEHTKTYNTSKPVLYTSASWGQRLVDACTKAGLVYGKDYLWWSAHYTGVSHFCGPSDGFGIKQTAHATQFTDLAQGKHLDESICSPGFFG